MKPALVKYVYRIYGRFAIVHNKILGAYEDRLKLEHCGEVEWVPKHLCYVTHKEALAELAKMEPYRSHV